MLPAAVREFNSWKVQRSNEDSAPVMIELFCSKPLAMPEASKTEKSLVSSSSNVEHSTGGSVSRKAVVGRPEVE